AKSNPMLPSFASMREEKAPPVRKSTLAAVVCQSSDAAFHCLMFSGVVYARQTCSTGAATVVSTLIFKESLLFLTLRLRGRRRAPLLGAPVKPRVSAFFHM